MNLHWFFCGWTQVEICGESAAAVLNLCMRYELPYRHWHRDRNSDRIRFDMSRYTAWLFLRRCSEEGIDICSICHGGLPHVIYSYRHRAGLLLGGILGIIIFMTSSRVLWDIRISGNEKMTVRQVREELSESGLYIGMPLSSLDSADAEMQIQLDSEYISWVSVNMSGTVAYVNIRERVPTPNEAPLQPANLVARCEGVVEELEVYTGNVVIQPGQAVQAGELLVSGVYDSQAVGWRVTRAAGRVLARTVHDFCVEIPLVYEQKVYPDSPIRQKTLIFFEKEIKLFKNSGILGTSCDKIDYIDTFAFGEGVSLPFSVQTELYFPYEYCTETRDHLQAQAMAYYELERQISAALPDAVLLRKSLTATLTDDAYLLKCKVWCLEDIAEIREFSVGE